MTEIGLCHNATWPQSRLSVGAAKRYRPRHARTITYWREDESSWRQTLEACRDLAELGIKNLIVFNTEAFGGRLVDVDLMQERLHAFLRIARDEYAYVDPDTFGPTSPVHGIEPLNEIDTPGWDDGAGGPITPQCVLDYTYAAHGVATRTFGIETVSPSFLGGPKSDLPVAVLSELARDGRVKVATFHMYGRSVMGEPAPGWIWGTVEDGIVELLEYVGDMELDLTEGGCWTISDGVGPEGQRRFVAAQCAFQHPRVRRNYIFAINDWCCGEAEYEAGKDFGLEGRDGVAKLAAGAFDGALIVRKPRPTPDTPGPDFVYVLGFRKFYERLVAGGIEPGRPLENEWSVGPGHVLQRSEHGMFDWVGWSKGTMLTYVHADGRRFRWDESWPTYQEIADGEPRLPWPEPAPAGVEAPVGARRRAGNGRVAETSGASPP